MAKQLRLCDCPGLVFPSLIPKHIQIVSGIYSIAQVQEPLSCIRFVAERIPLVEILKLVMPDEDEFHWSPWTICEAFAFAKGFLNAKSGRPDVHRAANLILRMVCDGKLVLSFKPKGYTYGKPLEAPRSQTVDESIAVEGKEMSKTEKKRRQKKQKQNRLLALIDGNSSE
jgi:ribosome biogenesis GTPase A